MFIEHVEMFSEHKKGTNKKLVELRTCVGLKWFRSRFEFFENAF